ncbi:MAG TPA: Ppx/GppA family phosphatase [Eubacteriaceae bacterium]|nr:Ppx/GppA family phosphatase [Eubacteriaceae bacterium]
MKIAAVDIGTNSMRLMIAKIEDEKIVHKEKYLFFTRMGEGMDKSKTIPEEVIERNINSLKEIKGICDDREVDKIIAYGTSALRDAENKSEFINRAMDKSGIKVEVISGEEEAYYGYLGVSRSLDLQDFMIMDVGGGSTEFIRIENGEKKYLKSLNIGSVRLNERFSLKDPPDKKQLDELMKHLDEIFDENFGDENVDASLVGIGGTATALSAINLGLDSYDPDKIDGSVIAYDDVEKIFEDLSQMRLDERLAVKGLEPKRADIIVAGAAIIKRYMERDKIREIIISDSDNLEGSVYHNIKKK